MANSRPSGGPDFPSGISPLADISSDLVRYALHSGPESGGVRTVRIDPDVWTGCVSQVRFCRMSEVADMYPAYLIGTWAVAMMGIRTRHWSHYRTGSVGTIWVTRLWVRFSVRSMQSSQSRTSARLSRIRPRSPRYGLYRTSCRASEHSTRCARACWPGPWPACSCACVVTPSRARARS